MDGGNRLEAEEKRLKCAVRPPQNGSSYRELQSESRLLKIESCPQSEEWIDDRKQDEAEEEPPVAGETQRLDPEYRVKDPFDLEYAESRRASPTSSCQESHSGMEESGRPYRESSSTLRRSTCWPGTLDSSLKGLDAASEKGDGSWRWVGG